ncbi:dihydroorotate dehydrogenase 2 [Candidatus Tenderia electrophaga]|jgi:dihydroorotate dehydrogenase|uniref:Dihydroorotate dehydrogenase (quinone) n=1 Tax=Candidatus Tenderia electrophaga TaxID=1748243 RepID=A0A0S2TDZ8_9GAMM|nr:dihydroorotate dehydrogenase 2 [Candidatus Tenderia electrophaga]
MPGLYSLLRPLVFCLDPEQAHTLTLNGLDLAHKLRLIRAPAPRSHSGVKVMGLDFPAVVGLAAGLDKNGDHIDALAALGFGFIEVGTVTPRPQPGNPRPRMFRIPQAEAIINRMGFNNLGVDHLVQRVKQARFDGIIGINIGKNFDTPIEKAVDDYVLGLQKVYVHADYVTVNISSPNTANLRELQNKDQLGGLLSALKQEQQRLQRHHDKYVPLVLKIAPDVDDAGLKVIAETLIAYGIDGVIATNTTLSRQGVEGLPHGDEQGGLSGAPLTQASTQVVKTLYRLLGDKLPIIAAGGILSAEDAQAKLDAGARLVQVYSGLIYRGPHLVRDIIESCHIGLALDAAGQ